MSLWSVLLLSFLITFQQWYSNAQKSCDVFQGSWVLSNSSSFSSSSSSCPLYNSSSCPFIQREFNCLRNGRPDEMYLEYTWQPHGCDLPSFDGAELLRRYKGKSIMFVGDSLSRNQWQSLLCMLYTAVPETKYNELALGELSIFTFEDFGVKIMLDHTVYLVDIVKEPKGRILKLDSIKGAKRWIGIDVLVFNTWHWWNRRGPSQPWDYIEVDGQYYKDMDRVVAFGRALQTWARWVETNVDPTKTKVLFQGISPSHYNGSAWDEPSAKTCLGQTQPVPGSVYPGALPYGLTVLKRVLDSMTVSVILLDVTKLSLLRKDGHPSIYGLGGETAMDCSHWCLPGVPDTWNQILYSLIL